MLHTTASRVACALLLACAAAPAALAQGWVAAGDEGLRSSVERLVDERVIDIPMLAWPLPTMDLQDALAAARARPGLDARTIAAIADVEAALAPATRRWSLAAGSPSDLRTFTDAPRESGEAGVELRWVRNADFGGELHLRTVAAPRDEQSLRPDGSYLSAGTGRWLLTGGWIDRWWGGGQDGSLELSSNARPVFSLGLDRRTSQPFESRWLRWLGPWTLGTFMGALEQHRIDSNHALLWGMRAAARPLPGLEVSVTRNAQWCGTKPPCNLHAFWNVFSGHDNVGESVSAQQEPGNQLATYEFRWAGRLGGLPLSVYYQNTGETIDNKFPRPLRALTLVSLGTWGETAGGARWRTHLEFSTTTCADFNSAQTADCAYENTLFNGGYRYQGRVLGHSTDSDSRQWVLGLLLQDTAARTWTARLRRAEVNRIGGPNQVNQLLSRTPQLWWVGEATLAQPFAGGHVEAALGLEHRHDESSGSTRLEPRGYLRFTHDF